MLLRLPCVSPLPGAWRGDGAVRDSPSGPKSLPPTPVPHPQDVSAERSLELPELYVAGQKDELFNYRVFLQALAHGMLTSLVNFFVTLGVSHNSAGPLSFSDYQSFAVVVATSGLLSITMEVGRTASLSHPRGSSDTSH